MLDRPPPQAPVEPAEDDPVGIAGALSHLPSPQERIELFRSLPEAFSHEVFQWLDHTYQQELLGEVDAEEARRLVEELAPDDRAHLVGQMPDEQAEELLATLGDRERRLTELLLAHPPESAGYIMSPDFLGLSAELRVEQALALVRERGRSVETIYVLPVVDEDQRLQGVVELGDLLLAESGARVREVMKTEPYHVAVGDDQERVARLMMVADLLAIPVLDALGRVVGIVTIDDAMDVLSFEEAEDLARTGAAEPLDQPYFSASVLKLARSRVVWLLVLVVAATLTVNVLDAFEDTLEQVVSLALFIPLLIGTGGNAGAQSATTIIRAMAIDEVRPNQVLRVVVREATAGALLGTMLGLLSIVPVWAFFGREMSLVVSVSLLTICTLASLVGSLMPIMARRVGVDPAVVSAPFVTTIVDASGLLVYFLIAQKVMLP